MEASKIKGLCMLWLRHNKKIKTVLNFHAFNFIPPRKRVKEEIVVSFFLLFFLLSYFLVLSFLPAWLPPCLSPFFQERLLLLQNLDEFWSLNVQFQLDTNCSLCFIVYISFLFWRNYLEYKKFLKNENVVEGFYLILWPYSEYPIK